MTRRCVDSAEDDDLTVTATDSDRVLVTHDREFTTRRKRNTVGPARVRVRVEQPDGPEVIDNRLDELIEALGWTAEAVEVFRTKGRDHPPRRD